MAKDFKGNRVKAMGLTAESERLANEAVSNDGSQNDNNNQESNVASNKASNVQSDKVNKQAAKQTSKKERKKAEEQVSSNGQSQQQSQPQGEILTARGFVGGELRGSGYTEQVTKGVQVRMPEDIYMGLSLYKLQHRGITLQELVIRACREWLERNK